LYVDFQLLLVILKTGYTAYTHGKSWNLGIPFSRPGKSWKIAMVMESHGK